MKKALLTLVTILSVLPFISNAQWSGATPGKIYYNDNNVGIGTSNPTQKLDV